MYLYPARHSCNHINKPEITTDYCIECVCCTPFREATSKWQLYKMVHLHSRHLRRAQTFARLYCMLVQKIKRSNWHLKEGTFFVSDKRTYFNFKACNCLNLTPSMQLWMVFDIKKETWHQGPFISCCLDEPHSHWLWLLSIDVVPRPFVLTYKGRAPQPLCPHSYLAG